MTMPATKGLTMLYFHNMKDVFKIWNIHINEDGSLKKITGFNTADVNYTLM